MRVAQPRFLLHQSFERCGEQLPAANGTTLGLQIARALVSLLCQKQLATGNPRAAEGRDKAWDVPKHGIAFPASCPGYGSPAKHSLFSRQLHRQLQPPGRHSGPGRLFNRGLYNTRYISVPDLSPGTSPTRKTSRLIFQAFGGEQPRASDTIPQMIGGDWLAPGCLAHPRCKERRRGGNLTPHHRPRGGDCCFRPISARSSEDAWLLVEGEGLGRI